MIAFAFEGFPTGQPVALDLAQGALSASASVPSWNLVAFAVGETAGEAVVTYGTGGPVTVTIAGGPYGGTDTQDAGGVPLTTAALEAAPMCLALPVVSGTTNVGDTLSITPGLWLYSGADPGDPAFRHRRDGADIAGGVGLSHVVGGQDQGSDFTVAETLGGVTVTSAPLAIPAPSLASDALAVLWYSPDEVSLGASNAVTAWPNHVAGSATDWDLTVVPADVAPPIWDGAAGKAIFAGAHALRSAGATALLADEVLAGGNTLVFFAVLDSKSGDTLAHYFGFSAGTGENVSAAILGATTTDTADIRAYVYARNGAAAYGSPYLHQSTANVTPSRKMLMEMHVGPATAAFYIDGRAEWSGPVAPTNLPGTAIPAILGARGSATATVQRAHVDIYEVFATTNAGNAAFFRSELATRHGITLL